MGFIAPPFQQKAAARFGLTAAVQDAFAILWATLFILNGELPSVAARLTGLFHDDL
jgi:hypothetical protein